MVQLKKVLQVLAVFLVWTLASFFCHKLAKMSMNVYVKDLKTSPIFVLPLMVTLSQMACCWGLVRMHWNSRFHPLLVLSHFLATLATNTSMALTFASSTLAIKMLEPATSAVLQRLMQKTRMGGRSVLGLLLVVVGAVMYVGLPWMDEALTLAVLLAFLSNVVLGVRNVTVKLSQENHDDDYTFRRWSSFLMFFVSIVVCLLLSYSLETSATIFPPNATYFLSLALASGVCHVTYSYMSMKVVLSYMSVVSHAMANIFKRVLVVLLLHVTGRRLASLWNWAGLVLCALGMYLYQRYKSSSLAASKENIDLNTGEKTMVSRRSLQRLLFLLTIPYIICVMSVGMPVMQRGTNVAVSDIPATDNAKSLWQYLQGNDFLRGHQTNQQSSTQMTPGALNPRGLPFDETSSELNSETLNVDYHRGLAFDSTSNELHSEILKVDRMISTKVVSTTDYAKRLYLGLEKWKDGQLLINQNVGFQPARKSLDKAREFLSTKPVTQPFDTDGLSPYLTTTRAAITEAQRLHLSLFRDLLAGKKYAIMFGLASFENKGDPAISVGEVVLLERLGIDLILYNDRHHCNKKRTKESLAIAGHYPADQVAIVMRGGGNLIGYPSENNCRRLVMKYFSSYQMIIFSESIYMRGNKSSFDSCVSLYCCNPNLTILLRDRQSLFIAKRIFNNGTRLVLAPDMAFHIGPVSRYISPYYDVMWLYRKDGERPKYMNLPSFPATISVGKGDWIQMPSLKGNTSLQTAVHILLHGYEILQRGRVVITERLHGHILCVLLDIPHVLLDNSDLKLSSYHNTWTRGISNCRLTSSASQAVHLAMELLQHYNSSLPPVLSAAHIKG